MNSTFDQSQSSGQTPISSSDSTTNNTHRTKPLPTRKRSEPKKGQQSTKQQKAIAAQRMRVLRANPPAYISSDANANTPSSLSASASLFSAISHVPAHATAQLTSHMSLDLQAPVEHSTLSHAFGSIQAQVQSDVRSQLQEHVAQESCSSANGLLTVQAPVQQESCVPVLPISQTSVVQLRLAIGNPSPSFFRARCQPVSRTSSALLSNRKYLT